MSNAYLVLAYWAATGLRLWLLGPSASSSAGLSERVEIATPLNSFKRLTEGVSLYYDHGVDPYAEGVLFHETPVTLYLMDFVRRKWPNRVNSLFILLDILTAAVLGRLAKAVAERWLRRQNKEVSGYHDDAKSGGLVLTKENLAHVDRYAQLAFLFNPFTMANCAGKTTTVLANLATAVFLLCMVKRWRLGACLALAWATYQSFYPVMLVVPLCLAMLEGDDDDDDVSPPPQKRRRRSVLASVLLVLMPFLLALSGLLYASYLLMGRSLSFVPATYGFILSVPELTPNTGLFWYFFTEMFEHFRVFFVCTFQLNVFVYVAPLAVRLRKDPFLLSFSLLALTAIFKSYPCYGDVGFYLSLLPVLQHLFPFTKQLFVVSANMLATTALGPILHHLWIYNGSANANYFFAINLVYNTGQIFLVTDVLFAYVKREFYLANGYKVHLAANAANKDKKVETRLVLK